MLSFNLIEGFLRTKIEGYLIFSSFRCSLKFNVVILLVSFFFSLNQVLHRSDHKYLFIYVMYLLYDRNVQLATGERSSTPSCIPNSCHRTGDRDVCPPPACTIPEDCREYCGHRPNCLPWSRVCCCW